MIRSHPLRSIAAILLFSFSLLLLNMPVSQAIDPVKITLPAITDKSGYRSNELNAALLNKLRSQFRFPKYEIEPVAALNRDADRPLLEKLAADTVAGGVVNLEITVLTNRFHHGFFDDETYESTYLTLTLSFYNKQTRQYGKLATSRSATEIVGVFSGPTPLALAALEDLLNQLDKVFPRLFPGPRY